VPDFFACRSWLTDIGGRKGFFNNPIMAGV
jgi:hypothetical protein